MNPSQPAHRPALRSRPQQRQRGVSLIVALVMLTALGLLAAWSVKSATTNVRVVGNTQARQVAFSAAQAALEQTISTPLFSQQPQAVADNPIPVDVDGNGIADVTALLDPAPECYRWRAVRTSELDAGREADRACLASSAAGNAGIDTPGGMASGDSLCADSEWNVRATVTDPATGARVAINQGVAIRGLITDVNNNCPAAVPPL